MPTVTDWIMVVITAVYVIATVFICYFNGKSARASRDQIAESHRQFDETKRLQVLPCLSYSLADYERQIFGNPDYELDLEQNIQDAGSYSIEKYLIIKNIGNGALNGITAYVCNKDHPKEDVPVKPNYLCIGDEKKFYFLFHCLADSEMRDAHSPKIELHYKDLLGNHYMQTISFHFKYSTGFENYYDYKFSAVELELSAVIQIKSKEDEANA